MKNRKSQEAVTHGKYEKGITLIALIITIILLLILAGVAINFALGDNGILRGAEYAVDKYKESADEEQSALDEFLEYIERENLPENTPETDAGTPVKTPSSWGVITPNITSTANGDIVEKSTKLASVYAVSDGQGETIPVPKGFFYVGGTLATGVVISDKQADQNKYAGQTEVPSGIELEDGKLKYNLIGNQFVWIPCDETTYVKKSFTNSGVAYWDQITQSAETKLACKYGGFYVARFEAGLPKGTEEFNVQQPNTGSNTYYNNVEGQAQSKPGISPWDFIDWDKSQINAQKMYKGNESVHSGLITGTQWDVIMKKLESTENRNVGTDSKEFGNYYQGDTAGFDYIGRASLYSQSGSTWYQQSFGEVGEGTKLNSTYYLLTTGASDHNRAYNIYDIAGNVWEWTEEVSYYSSATSVANNRVLRGGCFASVSSTNPAAYRTGDHLVSHSSSDIGFRVVLYIR